MNGRVPGDPASRVCFGVMVFTMTIQIAALFVAEIFESQQSAGVCRHNVDVEVDQVAVVDGIPLGRADAMGVMAR